jgi:flavoprotein
MKMIKEKYGNPILIFQNVNGDEIVYNYELLQKWKNSIVSLIELYRDYESGTEAGHFVNRIYCDEDGNLWLTRYC